MNLLFKLTTKGRPKNAIRAVRSVYDAERLEDVQIMVAEFIDDGHAPVTSNFFYIGNPKNKVAAINAGLDQLDFNWDVLVNLSDDQIFTDPNFIAKIRDAFKTESGYNLDQYIHFPDPNHKPWDALCTMSIIGRDYYNRDGYIYHPSYISVWCDNESMDVAKRRGCYKFVPNYIYDHLHPAYGKAPNDAQYQKTEHKLVHQKDHRNYQLRKLKGFPQ